MKRFPLLSPLLSPYKKKKKGFPHTPYKEKEKLTPFSTPHFIPFPKAKEKLYPARAYAHSKLEGKLPRIEFCPIRTIEIIPALKNNKQKVKSYPAIDSIDFLANNPPK